MKPAKASRVELLVCLECPHCGKDLKVERIDEQVTLSSSSSGDPAPTTQAMNQREELEGAPPASESVEAIKQQIEEIIDRDESGKAMTAADQFPKWRQCTDMEPLQKLFDKVVAAEQAGIAAEERHTAEAEQTTTSDW